MTFVKIIEKNDLLMTYDITVIIFVLMIKIKVINKKCYSRYYFRHH